MIRFIYIKVMVNDGMDFQNLYSYRSFIYLRYTLIAKKSGQIQAFLRKNHSYSKNKPQNLLNLIRIFLSIQNESGMHFELWPQVSDFARFLCGFALKWLGIMLKRFHPCQGEII